MWFLFAPVKSRRPPNKAAFTLLNHWQGTSRALEARGATNSCTRIRGEMLCAQCTVQVTAYTQGVT